MTGETLGKDVIADAPPDARYRISTGLAPMSVSQANMDALGQSKALFNASAFVDESCGITFIWPYEGSDAPPASELKGLKGLKEGTYVVLPATQHRGDYSGYWGKDLTHSTLYSNLLLLTQRGETCATGPTVQKSNGEKWLLTAAHCLYGSPTISYPGSGLVGYVSGNRMYQGSSIWYTNQVSLGSTQYFLHGGKHDMAAIQLNNSRTLTDRVHINTQNSVNYSVNPAWWYWTSSMNTQSVWACHSGPTSANLYGKDAKCGSVRWNNEQFWRTNGVTGSGSVYFTHIIRSHANSCAGDSGSAFYAANNDNNLAGLLYGGTGTSANYPGTTISCSTQTHYTGLDGIQALGLQAPITMS